MTPLRRRETKGGTHHSPHPSHSCPVPVAKIPTKGQDLGPQRPASCHILSWMDLCEPLLSQVGPGDPGLHPDGTRRDRVLISSNSKSWSPCNQCSDPQLGEWAPWGDQAPTLPAAPWSLGLGPAPSASPAVECSGAVSFPLQLFSSPLRMPGQRTPFRFRWGWPFRLRRVFQRHT